MSSVSVRASATRSRASVEVRWAVLQGQFGLGHAVVGQAGEFEAGFTLGLEQPEQGAFALQSGLTELVFGLREGGAGIRHADLSLFLLGLGLSEREAPLSQSEFTLSLLDVDLRHHHAVVSESSKLEPLGHLGFEEIEEALFTFQRGERELLPGLLSSGAGSGCLGQGGFALHRGLREFQAFGGQGKVSFSLAHRFSGGGHAVVLQPQQLEAGGLLSL